MLLYLAAAALLALAPYPPRLRPIVFVACLVAAVLLAAGGTLQIVMYGGDGLLMGGVFLVLAGALVVRAARTRRWVRFSA
jgi:hypothetical protein